MRPLTIGDPALLAPHLPSAEDSEVTDWVARAVANGGSVSTATRSAVNTFMGAIKAASLRTKMLRVNLFCGDDFVHDSVASSMGAVQVPLIKDKGGALDVFSGPTNYWTYAETGSGGGLTSASSHMGTGLIPASDYPDNNSVHLAAYVRTARNEASFALAAGASTSPFNALGLTAGPYSDGKSYAQIYDNSPGANVSDGLGVGFYLASRTASNAQTLYKNGSSIATSSAAAGAQTVDLEIDIFDFHGSVPSHGQFCLKTLGGYSIGLGLTSTEQLALYNAMQAFQTALTRNV